MSLLVSKIVLLTSVLLATCIIAETAYPQDYRNPPKTDSAERNGAADVEPVDRRHITTHPNDVRSGNRVIGRDPDPFIRGEILRHYNSSWPD
ncbi:hypothetical protein [Bradyrhizobium sp.]|jgi:hypothetical protein|uniref:hypothetical protein n=1 Tax=Bradyrhizobium sp. TaxID=376 RepID=UPI003C75228A